MVPVFVVRDPCSMMFKDFFGWLCERRRSCILVEGSRGESVWASGQIWKL